MVASTQIWLLFLVFSVFKLCLLNNINYIRLWVVFGTMWKKQTIRCTDRGIDFEVGGWGGITMNNVSIGGHWSLGRVWTRYLQHFKQLSTSLRCSIKAYKEICLHSWTPSLMEVVSFTLRPLDLRGPPLDRWVDVLSAYPDRTWLAKRNEFLFRELPCEPDWKATSFPVGYLGGMKLRISWTA